MTNPTMRQVKTQRVPDPSRSATTPPGMAGLLLFSQYAYPPNELGYCGPDDHRALFDYGTTGTTDRGLVEIASGFPGPWPYLTLMAGTVGLENPFDERLVEAYWVGNDYLDRVDMADFGRTVEDYFRPRAGGDFDHLTEAVGAGAVAHHSFHVFGVYPWVGLLKTGKVAKPVEQMDRCRIRWGKVGAVNGDEVDIRYQPLTFDGTKLLLGAPETETVIRSVDGVGFVDDLAPGDWVSAHWHWVCDKLDARQLTNLRRYTARQLDITNCRVAHSGPGMAMAGS